MVERERETGGELDRSPNSRATRRAVIAGVSAVLLLAGSRHGSFPLLVWNASASSPRGLYALVPGAARTGDYVIARPPAAAETFAHARGYLPRGVPLVKTAIGSGGDNVCAVGKHLWLNSRPVAVRLPTDRAGRTLPWWSGCRELRANELLLLGLGDAASFDGRYFGPVGTDLLLGRAVLLWRA